MAFAALKPCQNACGALTSATYCEPCKTRIAPKRASRHERGYGLRWEKERAVYLRINRLCVDCSSRGRIVVATEVDHITPHRGNDQLFWDQANWQALCKPCHSRKTAVEDGRFGDATKLPTLIRPMQSQFHVVCGPHVEASYRYAEKRAGIEADTIVIELERLMGGTLYEVASDKVRRQAMITRNRLLRDACELERWRVAWLVTDAPLMSERRHWRMYAASVTVLAPSLDRCLSSIASDSLGGKPVRERAARTWWQRYSIDPNDRVVTNVEVD